MHINTDTNDTAMDLLKDPLFLRWQLFKQPEDETYWKELCERRPMLKAEIKQAVALYEANIRWGEDQLSEAEIAEQIKALQHDLRQRSLKKRYTWMIIVAAAGIVLCLALFPLFRQMSVDHEKHSEMVASSSYQQLITPPGQRSMVILADGTRAYVNANSRLVYPTVFKPERREIYVEGEVYLEVSRDEQRPFVVRTHEMEIEVLGTKFNLSAHPDEEEKSVVLVSGLVRIAAKGKQQGIVLQPNQRYAQYKGTSEVKCVDASVYTLWTQGLYAFEHEPLRQILSRLERYYGVHISCDDAVANLTCSGKLDLKENVSRLLKELSGALPIICRQQTDGSYQIQRK